MYVYECVSSSVDVTCLLRSLQTYDEARQVAESFSRLGQLTRTSTSRRDAAVDKSPKSRLTRTLIDASTSLRYEMDTIRRLAGGLKLGGAGTKHEVTAGGEALGVV